MEESLKERLRKALRSGVGGYFSSQHDHRLPFPPAICLSLRELRLILEISGPYKHDHLSLINLGLESKGKDKAQKSTEEGNVVFASRATQSLSVLQHCRNHLAEQRRLLSDLQGESNVATHPVEQLRLLSDLWERC